MDKLNAVALLALTLVGVGVVFYGVVVVFGVAWKLAMRTLAGF